MKLSLPSFTVLALAGLSLAQDNWSSSSSASASASAAAASSSASPSAVPSSTNGLNATAPAASSTAVAGGLANSTNSLASNATSSASSAGNVTLPVNGTGPAIQANPPVNVSVPTTNTASCSSFLTTLNTDSELQTCLAPTLKVLESGSASISTFCNVTATQACPSSTIRRFLAYFSGNCSQELASGDKNVVPLYDALYLLTPMTQAVCAKDTTGNYCAANATTTAGNGGAANVGQQPLGVNGLPNADAFTASNVAFLGANANLNEQDLCTTCTRNVITSYFAFEASMPYTGGLASSPLLGAQNPLYSAIQTKCPTDFLSSALDNAGAAPGAISGAISSTPAKGLISLLIVAASFISFF